MSSATIRDHVKEMKSNNKRYYELASVIWQMLLDDEKDTLVRIATHRNTWEGPVIKDPHLLKLLEGGLITKATAGGEEGLLVLTFPGYAVFKSGQPKDPNIILPGEARS